MPNDFYGLPLHPLIVHATVVMIPLAVLAVILSAAWPRFRAWAGPMPAGLSLVGLILVPLSTSTGETLEKHVTATALVEKHTQMAEGLLPWMIGLFVFAAAGYFMYWRSQRSEHGQSAARALTITVSVLAIVAGVGAAVQVARIGHSGATSAWDDTNMSSSTRP